MEWQISSGEAELQGEACPPLSLSPSAKRESTEGARLDTPRIPNLTSPAALLFAVYYFFNCFLGSAFALFAFDFPLILHRVLVGVMYPRAMHPYAVTGSVRMHHVL